MCDGTGWNACGSILRAASPKVCQRGLVSEGVRGVRGLGKGFKFSKLFERL